MLVASILTYLLFVTFAVATAWNARRLLLDILHYVAIAGSVCFLSGLYFCANGPNKTSVPRQATAALILGVIGVGVFYLFLGSAHITHTGSFGKHAAVPEPFALFGLGSILIFALSHAMTVWTLNAVTRAVYPATTYKLHIVYLGVVFVFLSLLGAYVVLIALTDQALYRISARRDQVVDRSIEFRDAVLQLKSLGFWAVLPASVPVHLFFVFLIGRARRALKKGACPEPTMPVTGS